jgi:hypothetical protein
VPATIPRAAFSVARQAPSGEAAADTLGRGQNVGHHAQLLIGIESAGARNAGLHLIENQHQVMLVAQRAQSLQELLGRAP